MPSPVHFVRPPGEGPRLSLAELWDSRELLYFLIWRDVKARYKQTFLGFGWAILQPSLITAVFSLIFGRLARLPSDGLPYPLFYYMGALPWLYVAGGLQKAAESALVYGGIMKRVYFPRLLLPLSFALSRLLDLACASTVLVALMLYYGFVPSLSSLLLPAYLLLAVLLVLAGGLWLAPLNAIYRDVRFALPLLFQLWMFASPVLYPTSIVPESRRWLYGLNPMAGVIEGVRWALTGRGEAPGLPIFVSAVTAVLLLWGGLYFFQRMETEVVDRS